MKNLNDNKVTSNFWADLKKPIIGLSPMDGVTDQPCRKIQKKYGNPDVIYTEFANVEGICHGATSLLKDFIYDESQRPIVAQIYGKTPESFRQTAIILCQLGFDGIDINMGCPAKTVEHSGSGAALIKTPKLAQEIIKSVKQGIKDYLAGQRAKDCPDISEEISNAVEKRHQLLPQEYQQPRSIPVSVKTRIGYSTPVVETWIPNLLEMEPVAIALHGRTLKQQYSGFADWDEIKKAAELCHQTNTLILGNGDTKDLNEAHERIEKYGVDGILIGRATFGNPFVFQKNNIENHKNIFEVALDHSFEFEKTYSHDPKHNFLPMRKHLGWYTRSISNAKIVRAELFKTNNANEVEAVLRKFELI
ncbi:tRNA-dihydrouridine synthase [Candidatus Woesebacteria bacterium]|nr:tRNA-dihydrouridine synthase [Candidatus Woesebacteria bacterium]